MIRRMDLVKNIIIDGVSDSGKKFTLVYDKIPEDGYLLHDSVRDKYMDEATVHDTIPEKYKWQNAKMFVETDEEIDGVDGEDIHIIIYDTKITINEDDDGYIKMVKELLNESLPIRLGANRKSNVSSFQTRIQELKKGKITLSSAVKFVRDYLGKEIVLKVVGSEREYEL